MSKKSKSKNLSRRQFITRAGTGAVGSYVLLPELVKGSPLSELEQDRILNLDGDTDISLIVNGKNVKTKVHANTTLAELLRDQLKLTGTKIACNNGECGSCSVLLDGKVVYSCHMLALDAQDKSVITVEGLMEGENLSVVQKSFVEKDGFQCGFCTPGQVMAATALLNKNPNPTVDDIKEGMAGNICRCGAYPKIIDSVLAAAEKLKS